MLARPEFAETALSRALLQGLALSAHVRAALRAHEATHDVDVVIEGADDRIVLRGIVVNADENAAAEQVGGRRARRDGGRQPAARDGTPDLFPSNRQ